ncbi:MAG: 4-(cytidine 5'-diphospho)-2-C-methyl-D-erythritol kinase [Planctomycetaceae bacterium]|nr:4-(cytidine 5'-diphospho)-2-C-methyl-D-erythritol kinase [Planctomycetaceae bacterium]
MLIRRCLAKINIFLEVVGKRPDGYHDIESVFCEIPLDDILSAEAIPGPDIVLECSDPSLPCGDGNLVVKAARALRERCGVAAGMRFCLEKHIPAGAGLGGGSSDAAGALLLANEAWNLRLPRADLVSIAAGIGADVPFFLHGGTCLCRGIGEIVTPLQVGLPASLRLGLALPPIHSDTAAAYRGLRLPAAGDVRGADDYVAALEQGDADAIEAASFNRFEETVFAAIPALGRIRGRLMDDLCRPVRLSGSGSGLWFSLRGDESVPEQTVRWLQGEGVRLEVVGLNPNRKAGHFA